MRVRLLGEDLIAFRDSKGELGLVAENCPHRGASLFFGRNEEDGLALRLPWLEVRRVRRVCGHAQRAAGEQLQAQSESHGLSLRERGGVIWAYMGPENAPPPLPGFEWMDLPAEHRIGSKRVQETNWLQGMEGDIDQSHVSFTHSYLDPEDPANMGRGRRRPDSPPG